MNKKCNVCGSCDRKAKFISVRLKAVADSQAFSSAVTVADDGVSQCGLVPRLCCWGFKCNNFC